MTRVAARGAIWIAMIVWAAPAASQDDVDLDRFQDRADELDDMRRGGPGDGVAPYRPASPAVDYELDETPAEAPRSRRSPRHFSDISVGLPEVIFTAVAVDPGDGEVFFAGADGALFKTDDAGESWRPVLTFARGLSAINADGGRIGPLGRSAVTDADDSLGGGEDIEDPADQASGTDLTLQSDIKAFEEAQDEFDDISDARSDAADLPDGDADVAVVAFPHQAPGVRRIHFAAAESRLVYVATPQGLYISRDSGETFNRLDLPGGPFANDVRDVATDPNTRGRVYVSTAGGLLVGDGTNFRRAPGRIGFQGSLAVVARDRGGSTVVVVGTERGAFRSTDGGVMFRDLLLKGQSAFAPVGAVAYDERTRITYVGTANGVFAGERGAAILEARQALFGRLVTSISVDPKRLRGVAIGVRGRGVVESENTGLDIVSMPEQLDAQHVLDISRSPSDSDGYILATERGVFRHQKGTGIKVALDKLRVFRREIKKEPTAVETMERALTYARIHSDVVRAMPARARLAPLMPTIQASFRFRTSDALSIEEEDIEDFLGDDFEGEDVGDLDDSTLQAIIDELNLQSTTDPRRFEIWLRAEWDLDKLILNNNELASTGRRAAAAAVELRVAGSVRSLYVERRRLMAVQLLSTEKPDIAALARQILRMSELTSLLDAVTGGWFSEEARRRGASLDELSYEGGSRPRRILEGRNK